MSLADDAERRRAIFERERNVIVDAGAGTGKTTLLIERLLHLLAPTDDGRAFAIDRICAITFTRKAAGELKLRLREKLLAAAGELDSTPLRRDRLERAIEGLDNAPISTVHSFADRMLRLRPADAKVSPVYEIVEDPADLVEETVQWLLGSVDLGRLSCGNGAHPELEREGAETVQTFIESGLLVRTLEGEKFTRLGLDAFVRDVILTRDRPVAEVAPVGPLDTHALRRCLEELNECVKGLTGGSRGASTLRQLNRDAAWIAHTQDEMEALRRAIRWSRDLKKARDLQLRADFEGDSEAWAARSWIVGKDKRPGGPLGEALVAPLMAQMALRLVRLRPSILARYAEIKRARGVLDQVDLLIELRDLLAQNKPARAFYQGRFDHVMVDEFQDTDPLQAEIVLYLCEAGALADSSDQIALEAGKLTIVGDPKQSIYRFRRADMAMYAQVCAHVRRFAVCEAQLSVNFRSAASILDWLNAGFDDVLGSAPEGPRFDIERGSVRNVHLVPARTTHGTAGVHVLSFGDAELNAEPSRDVEGEALAHYIRYLVEDSTLEIADPHTRESRPPRYGDIAVMMIATQTVHHLTDELDRIGVPHVVRGGTLFMQDALHRQFVLGLRALADRRDGVARAALMRPPFFAVTLEDLLRERNGEPRSAALEASEAMLSELRRTRHALTPGEVARSVLEQTGFGQYVAAGVNGAQRLARVYELCAKLDELARDLRLDFDEVTSIARGWIDAPARIEAPLPIDADAVQVITAHQAKGLEWPIVALWDGRAIWRAYLPEVAFTVDAVSGAWALKIDALSYDPSRRDLHKRELALREQERRRVAYVATTRARDLLIIPEAGEPNRQHIAGQLLLATVAQAQQRPARYEPGSSGWWQTARGVSMRPIAPMLQDIDRTWRDSAQRSLRAALAPLGVSTFAHSLPVADDAPAPFEVRMWEGRFGPVFGSTVHRALQLLLERRLEAAVATQLATRENGLDHNQAEALADVIRVEATLRQAGLMEHRLLPEYPVSGSLEPGSLLSGYIDLLVDAEDGLSIVDFKTDQPPRGDVTREYPEYVAQVRAYGGLLERSGIAGARVVRHALLFTADGVLHWV